MTIIAHACLALILRFRPLGCRDSDFAQHGHKATQRSRFTAASDIPIAFQETVDDTFIEIAQADVVAVEPFPNRAIAYICMGTDDGQKPCCSMRFR